jgi:hypothetical protein
MPPGLEAASSASGAASQPATRKEPPMLIAIAIGALAVLWLAGLVLAFGLCRAAAAASDDLVAEAVREQAA